MPSARRSERWPPPIEAAPPRRTKVDWAAYEPPQPAFPGAREIPDVAPSDLVPYIDWTPFFSAWELRGTYPCIFENPDWGAKARELFDDAQVMLERLVGGGRLRARATYGFFPAAAVGDDIEVYADESRSGLRGTLHTQRQQGDKGAGEPAQALADFVAPRETGLRDWIGAFAVTAGIGAEELAAGHEKVHDDYAAIMVKALADRLAEALAEWLHRKARVDWGYGGEESLSIEELIREKYRGIRPAPGYPACPDHTEKRLLVAVCGEG